MAKKTFCLKARVVKGARWYIDYLRVDTETGQQVRHRRDFDLNQIENIEVRQAVAERLVSYIDIFAPSKHGRAADHCVVDKVGAPEMTVQAAIEYVRALKMQLPRKSSRSTYRTVCGKLLRWCGKMGYASISIQDFGRRQARAFWQTLLGQEYAGRTLNNYLVAIRTVWNVILEDEHITENPWNKIKPVRSGDKKRRPFTSDERRVIASEIQRTDYWLFRAVLLQYFCYIRPVELTRLHFRDFDLGAGLITVRSADAKSYAKRIVTIPESVLPYFRDNIFSMAPGNYYLFGGCERVGGKTNLVPGVAPVNEMLLYKRHRRVLQRLKTRGDLADITGLTWYSWKDTGISEHTRKTSPLATKDQAGHTDLSITSLYYCPEPVNLEYKGLQNDLLQ